MKIYDDVSIYFATSTIVDWYPVFTEKDYFDIVIKSLAYCRQEKGLRIHAYVVMLNHLHLIVSMAEQSSSNLSNVFRDFKRFTSRKITKLLRRDGKCIALDIFAKAATEDGRKNNFKVWQEGFHPKGIYDEKFGLQKLKYLHENPVKKGYVFKPEYWYYSNAGFYSGSNNGPLQIDDIFEF